MHIVLLISLLIVGCTSTTSQPSLEKKVSANSKTIDGYILNKPLETLRKHVIQEIQAGGVNVLDNGKDIYTSTGKNGEVLSYKGKGNSSKYPGYSQVRNVNQDRFYIIAKDVSYEGIRLGSGQSILRISNANKGRLVQKEAEFIQKINKHQ